MKRRIVCILLTVVLLMSCFLIPASAASHPFTDVKDKDWFSDAVEWVYANGCMNGTSATRFSPNQGMTRAMLVTVLWRMDGGWRPLNGVPFEDIEPDAYYTEAVKWTYSKHIVNGTSLTTFSPNQNVTREQLVTIIYRYAIFKRLDVTGRADLNQFPDAGKVVEYARDPFSWAIDAGIINGTDGKLAPQGRALRCQAAAILQRFDAWQKEHPAAPEPELPGPINPTEPTEHTHSFTASVTTPATCTVSGVMTYTCSCGDSYTEAIPAAGHSWETVHHDEIGHWLSVAKCNCGYTFSTTKGSELAYLFDAHVNEFPRSEISEHIGYVNWDEWIIDVPAYDEWVCTVCGETCSCSTAGHNWKLVHHDEEAHWIDGIECWCGWTCSTAESKYGVDEYGMYQLAFDYEDHIANYTTDEWLTEHGSYADHPFKVVDTPAYDEWVCTVCGETSATEP